MDSVYQSDLKTVRQHLVMMGEKAIEIVRLAVKALIDEDTKTAQIVLELDDAIDRLERTVDAEAIRYISLRNPVASDVRLVTVAMKAGHDFERIGDEASSIAKRTLRLAENQPVRTLGAIPKMADLVLAQLHGAVDCFVTHNSARAHAIPKKDIEIDELNRDNVKLFTQLVSEQPEAATQFIELIFISKSLERVGDHATNIAEEVVFLLEGDDIRHTEQVKRTSY